MTPKQLERIGKRIWGDNWKSPLARAVGRTYRQILFYHQGKAPIPIEIKLSAEHCEHWPDEARERAALD